MCQTLDVVIIQVLNKYLLHECINELYKQLIVAEIKSVLLMLFLSQTVLQGIFKTMVEKNLRCTKEVKDSYTKILLKKEGDIILFSFL